jgi:hypothetical protein
MDIAGTMSLFVFNTEARALAEDIWHRYSYPVGLVALLILIVEEFSAVPNLVSTE